MVDSRSEPSRWTCRSVLGSFSMSSRGRTLPLGDWGISKRNMTGMTAQTDTDASAAAAASAGTTHFATCVLCEASCGLAIKVEDGKAVRIEGNKRDVFSRGHVCPKAVALEDVRLDPDRVVEPSCGRAPRRGRVSWAEALAEGQRRPAACHPRARDARGRGLPGQPHGPQRARPSRRRRPARGPAAAHALLGHERRPAAAHARVARDVRPPGHAARCPTSTGRSFFLCIGANPLVSNGSIMTAPGIERRLAELRARGGKLVVVDPRRTETAGVADEHHFIRPGTDALLLMAMVQHALRGAAREARAARGARRAAWTRSRRSAAAPSPPSASPARPGIAADVIRAWRASSPRRPRGSPTGASGVCQQRVRGPRRPGCVNVLNVAHRQPRSPGRRHVHDARGRRRAARRAARPARQLRPLPQPRARPARVRRRAAGGRAWPRRSRRRARANPRARDHRGQPGARPRPTASGSARALEKLDFMVSVDIYRNETTRHAHRPPAHDVRPGARALRLALPRGRGPQRRALVPAAVRAASRGAPRLERAHRSRVRRCGGAQGEGLDGPRARRRALGARRAIDLAMRAGPHNRRGSRELEDVAARRGSRRARASPARALAHRRQAAAPRAEAVRRRRAAAARAARSTRAASGAGSCSSAAGAFAATTPGCTTASAW